LIRNAAEAFWGDEYTLKLLSGHYLSNPVPGRKGNDWLYTTGLGITVGR